MDSFDSIMKLYRFYRIIWRNDFPLFFLCLRFPSSRFVFYLVLYRVFDRLLSSYNGPLIWQTIRPDFLSFLYSFVFLFSTSLFFFCPPSTEFPLSLLFAFFLFGFVLGLTWLLPSFYRVFSWFLQSTGERWISFVCFFSFDFWFLSMDLVLKKKHYD